MNRVRLTLVGSILLVLLAAALLWLFILSPRLSEATKVAQQSADLDLANLTLQRQYKDASEQVAKAPEAAAQAQLLFARMPQTAELPAVLDQITAAAVDAGIPANDVTSLTTGIPVPVAAGGAEGESAGIQLAKMDVGMSANAAPDTALAFMDNLQALDRAMLLTSTNASGANLFGPTTGDLQSLQVAGSMFVLQSQLPDLVQAVEDLMVQAQADTAAATDQAEQAAGEGDG